MDDNSVMVGSPVSSTIGEAYVPATNIDPTTTVAPEPHTPTSTGPVFIGTRRFENQFEADRYLFQLEQKNAASSAPVPQATAEEVDIAQLMFEDPKAYTKLMEQRIQEKIYGEYNRAEALKTMWNDFYSRNPDLRDQQDIVQLVMNANMATIKDQPLEQSLPFLAKEARARISRIRGLPTGQGSELPSAPAITTGASGQQAPVARTQPVVMNDFISQVRSLNRRKA